MPSDPRDEGIPASPPGKARAAATPQWRRNVVVLGTVHFIAGASVSLVMPFLAFYMDELADPADRDGLKLWAGLAYSLPALAMMVAAPMWGALGDRLGRKPMLVRSTVGGAVALGLMSMCASPVQFALLRFMQGLLMGTLVASNALVATSAPAHALGRSLGVLRTMHWVGLGVGPLLGGLLAEAFGYRAALAVGSGLLMVATLALVFLVREEHPLAQTPRAARQPPEPRARVLRAPLLRLYCVDFLCEMARFVAVPVIPLLLAELSGNAIGVASVAGTILGLRAFSGAAGAYCGGRLSHRVGTRRLILIAATVAALVSIAQAFMTEPWQLATLQAIACGFAALIVPTVAVLLAHEAPRVATGAAFGLTSSFQSAGRFLGPVLGMAVGTWLGFGSAFIAIAAIFAAVFALSSGLPRVDVEPAGD